MSATKDGTQRGLCRNKDQVLARDEGGARLVKCLLGMMGGAGGTLRPWSSWRLVWVPLWGTSQIRPKSRSTQRGLPAEILTWSLPASPCPLPGRSRSWKDTLQDCHEWLCRLCTRKGQLSVEASGSEILQLGKGLISVQRLRFVNCLVGGDTFVC